MSERFNLRLTGTLTTLAPVTIVPPNAEEVVRADKSKYRRVASATVYRNGLRETRPIIPGSTLRGRLRRSAMEVYLHLAGKKVPLAEWHQNAVGGIKGAEAENAFDVVFRQTIREKNPILALFGAGSPWMMSRAKIENAIPQHAVETDLVGGVRADDGRREQEFFAKLTDDSVDEWMSLVDANALRTQMKLERGKLAGELRAARKAKETAEIQRIEVALKALEEKENASKALTSNPVSMPLTHEAVPCGVVMDHAMSLDSVTAEEVGLFMAAWNLWVQAKPAIGQHENVGYGLLSGEYTARLTKAADVDPFSARGRGEEIGTIVATPHVGLENVPEQLTGMMEAFRTAFADGRYDFRAVTHLQG